MGHQQLLKPTLVDNSTLHGIKSLLDHKYRTLIEVKFVSF